MEYRGESSQAVLTVSGRDNGGDDGIDVNFGIEPPTLHLGETATFRACSEMYPEPQPCVDDPNADLDFIGRFFGIMREVGLTSEIPKCLLSIIFKREPIP